MLRFRSILCAGILIAAGFCAPTARAADVSFEATVDENVVEQGASFILTLTVTGSANVPMIQLPAIDGIKANYLGPSTRIAIVNGQYSSSSAHMYSLIAGRTGHLTIPAISVQISGQTLTTDPIEIQVVDAGTYSQYAAGQNDQGQDRKSVV